MNLPNKLTILRVLMIPAFVLVMSLSVRGGENIDALRSSGSAYFIWMRLLACLIFCVASLTDFLDGWIARSRKLATDFGKFMDPLADKLLVCSCLILLCAEGSLPAWITILIISREFIISGFRLIAAGKSIVIAASWWGKVKTTLQMVLCIYLILPRISMWLGRYFTGLLVLAVLVLTILSLADYIAKNRNIITEGGF